MTKVPAKWGMSLLLGRSISGWFSVELERPGGPRYLRCRVDVNKNSQFAIVQDGYPARYFTCCGTGQLIDVGVSQSRDYTVNVNEQVTR